MNNKLYGAIEAGGTKFVCAVGTEQNELLEKVVFPTTSPEQTLGKAADFFLSCMQKYGTIPIIGVGGFGPINIDINSASYGLITSTPKKGWNDVNIVDWLKELTGCNIALDTDVNCALLAESILGAARDIQNAAYLTIGTGIGGGIMLDRKISYGFSHSEIGHTTLRKAESDKDFEGVCPTHGDACAEGLASGPAMAKRWGCKANELDKNHPGWQLEAYYLAMLCMNLLLTLTPQRIILGGGVMQQEHLFALIHAEFKKQLNGYLNLAQYNLKVENIIKPPGLKNNAGIIGALELAKNCYNGATRQVAK